MEHIESQEAIYGIEEYDYAEEHERTRTVSVDVVSSLTVPLSPRFPPLATPKGVSAQYRGRCLPSVFLLSSLHAVSAFVLGLDVSLRRACLITPEAKKSKLMALVF